MDIPYLEVDTIDDIALRVRLTREPLTIGRHAENSIIIDDEKASRVHCVIELLPDGSVQVRDLDSRNGTKVNEIRIASAILDPGDVIRVGKTIFRFNVSPVEDPAPSSQPGSLSSAPAPGSLSRPSHRPDGAEPSETDEPPFVAQTGVTSPLTSSGADAYSAVIDQLACRCFEDEFNPHGLALISAQGTTVFAAGSLDRDQADDTTELLEASRIGGSLLLRLLCFARCARCSLIRLTAGAGAFKVSTNASHPEMKALPDMAKSIGLRVLGVVKSLSEVDISQRHVEQEGEFRIAIGEVEVCCHCQFDPSIYGQSLTMTLDGPGGA